MDKEVLKPVGIKVRAVAALAVLLLAAGAFGCGDAGDEKIQLSAATTNFTEANDSKHNAQRTDYDKITGFVLKPGADEVRNAPSL